jgi:hypothetical protein
MGRACREDASLAEETMIGHLVSVTIVLGALIALDRPSCARRRQRFAAATAFAFVVMGICTMLEAVIFPIGVTLRDAIAGLVFELITASVLGAVVAWSRRDRSGISPPTNITTLRFAAAVLIYVVLYVTAGMLVFPFVRDFYASRQLPGFGTMVAMQLLRGSLYTAVGIPFIRTLSGSRWNTALRLGAAYALIGGLAPLIPENPYLPADVRQAHAIEIVASNFLYGVTTALIMRRRE